MRSKIRLQVLCSIFLLTCITRIYIDLILSPDISDIHQAKDLNNDYLNETDALKVEHPHELISMEEYLRFYKLDAKLHHVCPKVRRPHVGEISWKKGVYQHVRMKFEDYPGIVELVNKDKTLMVNYKISTNFFAFIKPF